VTRCGDAESPKPSLEPAETARTMRGDTDVTIAVNEDERDPLVPGDLLRCLTNEVQRRAKRVRCNAGLGATQRVAHSASVPGGSEGVRKCLELSDVACS